MMRGVLSMVVYVWAVLLTGCGTPVGGADQGIAEDPNLSVFFSDTDGESRRYGIDNRMIEDITHAQRRIRVAIYHLTSEPLTEALIDAHRSGIDVEVYTDDGHAGDTEMVALKNGGISVRDDGDDGALMHDKFMIIDSQIVWSGSTNYTPSAFYKNDENAVRIEDAVVAATYAKEFEALYTHAAVVPQPYTSDALEIYFSPENDFRGRMLTLIDHATTSIHFLIFSFTNRAIADALIRAAHRGVEVKGVFDKGWSGNRYSKDEYLSDAGIDVAYDANPYTLHDKVMILDGKTVITGSYNFTNSANDRNAENALVIHKEAIADVYENAFDAVEALARSRAP